MLLHKSLHRHSMLRASIAAAACMPSRPTMHASPRTSHVVVHHHHHPMTTKRAPRTMHVIAASSNGAPSSSSPHTTDTHDRHGYRRPPPEIATIVDAPVQPSLSFSPDRTRVLQLYRPSPYPPISELARPETKLAGLRIETDLWARSRMGYTLDVSIAPVTDDIMLPLPPEKEQRLQGVPPGYWLNYVSWSPDSKRIVFTLRSNGGPGGPPRGPLELWTADVEEFVAKPLLQLPQYGLNTVFEDYVWVTDEHIIASVVPAGIGPPPSKPTVPTGPRIEDNSTGSKAQSRTFTDLLQTPYDEDLFEYYATSQLVEVHVPSGTITPLSIPRMYTGVSVSPDEQFLLVSWMERPFSFMVPCGRFPKRVQLWDRRGNVIREIAHLPLAEAIPIATNSCRQGPRAISWRDDMPAQLCWIECQDGGDPEVEVSPRDIVYTLDAAVAAAGGEAEVLATTNLRCGGVAWCDDDLALLYQSWYKTRRSIVSMIKPGDRAAPPQPLFDRNFDDVYDDPGSPLMRRLSNGSYVIAKLNGERKLLMQGAGASPEGNRPFLSILDLDTQQRTEIWRSQPPYLESLGSILSDQDDQPITLDDLRMLMTRESPTIVPQYYFMQFTQGGTHREEQRISNFPHPYPTLADLQKEIIRYTREDGVELNGTLYLPPGYDRERDGPLPALLWAYPREFKSKDTAGQLRRSPYEFAGIGATSPLLWLARKFAILDGPTMPIIAEGPDEEPNDTYVEQLTSSARAAVDELVRRGVADPQRVAVGGHSYGAFMTANLLAHAGDLFACGIARSGAYNRTLTPFGFQAEERTLWQATDTYMKMSPYLQADKIKKPLLLIHGEDDNNTGTFPMQSERLYAALKGHGAPCRLVILPHESHGYRAYESIMHTLHEMDAWLQAHCVEAREEEEVAAPAVVSKL